MVGVSGKCFVGVCTPTKASSLISNDIPYGIRTTGVLQVTSRKNLQALSEKPL